MDLTAPTDYTDYSQGMGWFAEQSVKSVGCRQSMSSVGFALTATASTADPQMISI
jgi:hypothetical protein